MNIIALDQAPVFAPLTHAEPTVRELIGKYYSSHFNEPYASAYTAKYLELLNIAPLSATCPWDNWKSSKDFA